MRKSYREYLDKISAPIARQYLVQEYTAARPGDVSLMAFDCLIEEDGRWYIQFYQKKVKQQHRLPANREIRQVVEAQQQWILRPRPKSSLSSESLSQVLWLQQFPT